VARAQHAGAEAVPVGELALCGGARERRALPVPHGDVERFVEVRRQRGRDPRAGGGERVRDVLHRGGDLRSGLPPRLARHHRDGGGREVDVGARRDRHRRRAGVSTIGACDHTQREREVVDARGQRSDHGAAVVAIADPREVPGDRDTAERRLQPRGPAPCRGQPDAAARVASETEHRTAAADGRRFAAARRAGRARRVVRVAHRAVHLGLDEHRRLREQHASRAEHSRDDRCGRRCDAVRTAAPSAGARQSLDVDPVLHRERHTVQRADRAFRRVERRGARERSVGIAPRDAVRLLVHPLEARERGVHHILGAQLTGREVHGQFARAERCEIEHVAILVGQTRYPCSISPRSGRCPS
jgi:hypothetical protein